MVRALDLQLMVVRSTPVAVLSSNNLRQVVHTSHALAGRSGLAMARLIVVSEATGSCIYQDSHCSI